MEKIKQYKLIIILVLIILIISVFYFVIKQENYVSKMSDIFSCPFKDDVSYTECMVKNTDRNYFKDFSCPFKDNVSYTECMVKNFDRLSAIREWKQIKLESLKSPYVNPDNFFDLAGDINKIKKWRENFEKARDLKCGASVIFYYGSGSPASVATCGMAEEISALEILDDNYYLRIMSYYNGNKGISDFEPTEQDILKLMESNKTTREGCCGIW